MKRLCLMLLLLAPAAAAAQGVVYSVELRTFFNLPACPTGWVATGRANPAGATTYLLSAAGRTYRLTQGALNRSFTVSGVLDAAARDALIATSAVTTVPGVAQNIECRWRPAGGSP